MKARTPLLIGAAFGLLAMSLCISCFRLIGLSREQAAYAGLLTLSLFITFMVRRWNRSYIE